ncbi:Hsp20/alpha crystallin family protein [Kitasatospora sp. NPDC017646]|uniref:Hsp20/alpha crystallin family protein n=1 Tax=Kitasatospora sp. NPDC017646 TaxID=3364024 RepID=UPI0037A03A07
MSGEMLRRRAHSWPPFPDLFEDFPVGVRPSPDEHVIRVEESVEGGAYVIRAELPGVDPDKDVEVTVEGGVLTVRAERREEKKDKQRSEFRYGSFIRRVRLPEGCEEGDITAAYDKGVLTVKAPLPTTEKKEPHRVEITRGS